MTKKQIIASVIVMLAIACIAITRTHADKPEEPKDGAIYVWSLPNSGHQSLIILNVVDGTTFDAAYLVPIRVKLKGITIDEKNSKDAKTTVDKLIGGQLRQAQLHGVGPGGILVDFWIPSEKAGEKSDWLSSILVKKGLGKGSK